MSEKNIEDLTLEECIDLHNRAYCGLYSFTNDIMVILLKEFTFLLKKLKDKEVPKTMDPDWEQVLDIWHIMRYYTIDLEEFRYNPPLCEYMELEELDEWRDKAPDDWMDCFDFFVGESGPPEGYEEELDKLYTYYINTDEERKARGKEYEDIKNIGTIPPIIKKIF